MSSTQSWSKTLVICMGLATLAGPMGCESDPGVPVRTVSSSEDSKVQRTAIDRSQLEQAEGNWKPVAAWNMQMESRNPFRGFSDKVLAELILKERTSEDIETKDMQLPEQLYNSKDYKLVGVITGTAEPKAFVIDPNGNRFVLQRGSLIGNNNGRVTNIRRERIEIFERFAGEGRYIDLPLYQEENKTIQLAIQ